MRWRPRASRAPWCPRRYSPRVNDEACGRSSAWRSAGAPSVPHSASARLPDVHPRCGVDLSKVELEQGIPRHRLDHPPHAAARNDPANERRGVGIGGDLRRGRPDAELVVVGTRHRVDHTSRISPQVVPLRRGVRDGSEQAATGDDRAERMKAWGTVSAHRGEVRDDERRRTGGQRVAAVASKDAGPEAVRKRGDISRLGLELRPRRHAPIMARASSKARESSPSA